MTSANNAGSIIGTHLPKPRRRGGGPKPAWPHHGCPKGPASEGCPWSGSQPPAPEAVEQSGLCCPHQKMSRSRIAPYGGFEPPQPFTRETAVMSMSPNKNRGAAIPVPQPFKHRQRLV